MFSPGNLPLTNPVVLQRTLQEHGLNLLRGFSFGLDDLQRASSSHGPAAGTEDFGRRDLACTPGKVVLHNELIELIQYTPRTAQVHPEPVLIVPAWIMKYYILDLSPDNSLIRYLLDQGHTVFCISWKNPTAAERALGMEDYIELGFEAALRAVQRSARRRGARHRLLPGRHPAGHRGGGHGARRPRRLASMTLFAAQTDFSEPGELGLFIDESQLSLLEAQMAEAGT
jgi:polyhydroxyalkanoate synthase